MAQNQTTTVPINVIAADYQTANGLTDLSVARAGIKNAMRYFGMKPTEHQEDLTVEQASYLKRVLSI